MTDPCQLYLVSPLDTGGDFPDRLARALDAGPVAAFQFRVKGLDSHEAARLAAPLLELCRARDDVAFLVNDSVALARRLGADGVHLGQGDGDPREARAALGPRAQIGVTCHASRDLAITAGEAGGGLCRLWRVPPHDHQGGGAPRRSGDPDLVVAAGRAALRRHRRHHARQRRAADRGGRGLPGGVGRGVGRGRGGGGACLCEGDGSRSAPESLRGT